MYIILHQRRSSATSTVNLWSPMSRFEAVSAGLSSERAAYDTMPARHAEKLHGRLIYVCGGLRSPRLATVVTA